MDKPSKSERKREAHGAQSLGVDLLELTDEQLDELVKDERLRDALRDLRRFTSHGARYRQSQYVGKLMRNTDVAPLEQALAAKRAAGSRESQQFREVEKWRDRLLADDEGLHAWIAAHPVSDTTAFRALVRDARREREMGGSRSFRELFRAVREMMAKR
jgi:ribosome-associated protein